jgi:hypothetical protein
MIETSVEIDGLAVVLRALESIPDAFAAGVFDSAKTLRLLAQGRTPYKTGHAKRSWGAVETAAGGYSFKNPVDYTVTLEEGGYPRAGPRTIEVDGQVYSRQAVRGILTPLVSQDRTLTRIAQLIADEIERGINRAGT